MNKRAPKKLTDEQIIAALREARGNVTLAARKLGVARNTVQWRMDTRPEVKAAHDEAADEITDIAEGHLVSGVVKGHWDQIRYWLENKARHRGYGRAPQGNPLDGLTPEQVMAMTDEELDALIARHTRASGR